MIDNWLKCWTICPSSIFRILSSTYVWTNVTQGTQKFYTYDPLFHIFIFISSWIYKTSINEWFVICPFNGGQQKAPEQRQSAFYRPQLLPQSTLGYEHWRNPCRTFGFESSLSSSKCCALLVEDLLEALVAGHLHAQLHHLVNLLRLVLAPDHQHHRLQLEGHLLVHHGVLSPLLHHLGGTGSNRLLSDGLSHAGRNNNWSSSNHWSYLGGRLITSVPKVSSLNSPSSLIQPIM